MRPDCDAAGSTGVCEGVARDGRVPVNVLRAGVCNIFSRNADLGAVRSVAVVQDESTIGEDGSGSLRIYAARGRGGGDGAVCEAWVCAGGVNRIVFFEAVGGFSLAPFAVHIAVLSGVDDF